MREPEVGVSKSTVSHAFFYYFAKSGETIGLKNKFITMLTPKEFRMTSIPELAGFLLFFLYCIFDWPLLYIKRFSPLTGNVEITEKGLWTFLSEIDTIYFQLILYVIGVLLLFCTISTLLKGFVSKPSWAVFFTSVPYLACGFWVQYS